MAAETQAFIDEVKANGGATRQQVQAMIAALVPELGAVAQEVELLARLLAAAEITETDPAVLGKVEEGVQKLNAHRRLHADLAKAGRAYVNNFKQLIEWYGGPEGFRAQAADAGYTV